MLASYWIAVHHVFGSYSLAGFRCQAALSRALPPRKRPPGAQCFQFPRFGCSMSDVGCWILSLLPFPHPARNSLGFSPPMPILSSGKWLSNPNRSSTRKSCASRCGRSTSRRKRAPAPALGRPHHFWPRRPVQGNRSKICQLSLWIKTAARQPIDQPRPHPPRAQQHHHRVCRLG